MNKKLKLTLASVTAALEMLVGTALTAASFGMVIIPLGFAAGGVTGFSKILTKLLPIPLSAMVLAINVLLLLIGVIVVGKRFVAKTIAVSILFPALLEVFSRYPLEGIEQDPMLCTVVAGAMLGVGAGLVLRSGASAGGFDILAVALNKKYKIPVATVMNICDAAVIILQAVGQPLDQTIYGILVITVSAAIVGRVVTMGTGESQIMIFSEHHDEIREALLHEIDVGMTSLEAESGYSRNHMQVILTVVPYQKVTTIKKIVTGIDPTAFVVVNEIYSVLGRGYTLNRH